MGIARLRPESLGRAMLTLRALAVGAAVLAAFGPSLPLPTRARTIVALIDVSDSVGSEGIEASRNAAISLMRALRPSDRAAAAIFAGGAAAVFPPATGAKAVSLLESAVLSLPSKGKTDISAALALARELASEGPGPGTVYLFSDGRSNAGAPPTESAGGTARAAVMAVAASGPPAEFVSAGLGVPDAVRAGERVALTWNIVSGSRRRIEYELTLDGEEAAAGNAVLEAGPNELRLAVDAGDPGMKVLYARAAGEGGSGRTIESGAFLNVAGPARVLVVSGNGPLPGSSPASPIAAALETQGIRAAAGGPELLGETAAAYAGVAAVVLDNLSALAITEIQQSRLRDYVAGGGGLLVVGGESSLGRGEFYATPLEDMLPVETDSRRRLRFTRAKLLFVIDHSGSMAEEVGGTTKKIAAMRGIAAAISELNPLDEVGIIGFDTMATWVVPFTRATEKEKILGLLSGLGDGSGTDLAAAIAEAARGFGPPGPTKRHAIILTDGLTADADFEELAARLVAAGATASTIAIGDTVNEELLKDLAERCGGTYYRAEADTVPTVIDEETVKMTRELMQEGRIATRIVSSSALVDGLGPRLPRVGGYLRTAAKKLATVEIEAKGEGSEDGWDPLLATWKYGNGNVAVFTSDSGSRWLAAWSSLPSYNRLWGQAVRSVERAAPDGILRPRAFSEAGGARVVVDAVGGDRRSLSSLRLAGRVQGTPLSFSFRESAPGRYEGFAAVRGAGLFGIDIEDPISRSRGFAWVWMERGAETGARGPDLAALSLIAAANGGGLVSADRASPPERTVSWVGREARPTLVVIAAFLLLADLFLRSAMAGQLGRAWAAGTAWWARQKALAEYAGAAARVEGGNRPDPEREARSFELQRRLAERVAERNAAAAENSDA